MTYLREGIFEPKDLDILNGKVINDIDVKMPDSAKVCFATFFNKNQCKINTDVSDAYLSQRHKGSTATDISKSAIDQGQSTMGR